MISHVFLTFQKTSTELFLLLLPLLITESVGYTTPSGNRPVVTLELKSPLMEGELAVLKCMISGPFQAANDTILIERINGEDRTTLATGEDRDPQAPDNIVFKAHTIINDVHTVYVSFQYVNRNDVGNYVCKVVRQTGTTVTVLAEDAVNVDVQFPPSGVPICQKAPDASQYAVGDVVTLKCSSEAGNPPVPLTWYKQMNIGNETSQVELKDQSTGERDDVTYSEASLKLTFDMNGTTFDCIRNEPNFANCSLSLKVLNKTVKLKPDGEAITDGTTVVNDADGEAFDSGDDVANGNSIQYIIVAVVGSLVVVMVIVIIVVLVRRNYSKQPKKPNKRMISDPVVIPDAEKQQYSKLSTIEDGDVKEDNLQANSHSPKDVKLDDLPANSRPPKDVKSDDLPVYASPEIKKITDGIIKRSKSYPAPPKYPRPAKNRATSAKYDRPYENSEVAAKPAASDKPIVYANTLDVGSSVKKKENTNDPEINDKSTAYESVNGSESNEKDTVYESVNIPASSD